jgi:hypothetical protein
MTKKTSSSKMDQVGGLLFVGATVASTGVGLLMDQAGPGSVIGVGIGIILLAAVRLTVKD